MNFEWCDRGGEPTQEFWIWFEMRRKLVPPPYTRYAPGFRKMLADADLGVPEAVALKEQLIVKVTEARLKS